MHQKALKCGIARAAGLLVALLGSLDGRGRADTLERFEFARVEMAVEIKVIVYATDQQAANTAATAAYDRIHQLNAALSDYDPQSELSRLSKTAGSGQVVPLSDDLLRILTASQQMAERSAGAFDVTVGPIVQLWRRARRMRELPDPQRIDRALAAVGYKKLILDPHARTATLAAHDMQLDLGGIAKGYAADEALTALRAHGCGAALVGVAGDIVVGDPPPGAEAWVVALGDSTDAGEARRVHLVRQAVSTSGDASQYVEIDGVRYSHIVDPRTGQALTRRGSVTIVAPDCLTADSLASAACVLGPEQGLKLVEATPAAAGVFITREADDRETFIESARMADFWQRESE